MRVTHHKRKEFFPAVPGPLAGWCIAPGSFVMWVEGYCMHPDTSICGDGSPKPCPGPKRRSRRSWRSRLFGFRTSEFGMSVARGGGVGMKHTRRFFERWHRVACGGCRPYLFRLHASASKRVRRRSIQHQYGRTAATGLGVVGEHTHTFVCLSFSPCRSPLTSCLLKRVPFPSEIMKLSSDVVVVLPSCENLS